MDFKKENMSHKHYNSTSSWNTFKPILFIGVIPTIVIFAVIILTIGNIGKNNASEAKITNVDSVDSTYKLDKTSFSFGKISQKDGNVETNFELTNTGSSDIYVKKLYTSCMCTKTQIVFSDGSKTSLNGMLGHGPDSDLLVEKSIKAGETVKVRAVFDPNAHGPAGVGFIKRNITLETNLKTDPTIQVSFDAEVTK